MREILFRGKRLDTKQWEYGNYNNVNGKAYIFPEDAPDSYDNYQVDPDTVGQYTGLQDKNSKKIFEGDIVKCKNKIEEYIGIVDWDDCNPSMCIRFKSENGFNYVEYDFIKCGNMTIEILGNRWDNPELLKGGRTIKVFKITFETEAGCNDLSPFDEVDIYTKDIVERFDGRNIEVEEIGGTK